jgi:alkaline phosphatase
MRVFSCLFLLFLFVSAEKMPVASPSRLATARPKNVIFVVGDGMGLTHITAGMYANDNHTQLERCSVTGLIATHSASHRVTDSGAGATAFACGCKTYNGAIGVDRKKKNCPTLLEYAADSAGMATGIVVSCSVTHATPASFVAHVAQRSEMEEIATWYLRRPVDFLVGGGLRYFNQRKSDQRNLLTEMQSAGCATHLFSEKKLSDITPDPALRFAWFAAAEEPKAVTEGRDYLPLAAAMAPVFLKKRNPERGFFLLVEGSQIDWAGHANDGPRLLAEMQDFDAALKALLDWAEVDGQTLVVITADHETGGLTIEQGSTMDSLNLGFSTKKHTASLVPVFAFGPGAEQFGGVYDNTEIYTRIRRAVWQ